MSQERYVDSKCKKTIDILQKKTSLICFKSQETHALTSTIYANPRFNKLTSSKLNMMSPRTQARVVGTVGDSKSAGKGGPRDPPGLPRPRGAGNPTLQSPSLCGRIPFGLFPPKRHLPARVQGPGRYSPNQGVLLTTSTTLCAACSSIAGLASTAARPLRCLAIAVAPDGQIMPQYGAH